MKVTVDQHSGFCWGVVRTIDIAEEEMQNGEPALLPRSDHSQPRGNRTAAGAGA